MQLIVPTYSNLYHSSRLDATLSYEATIVDGNVIKPQQTKMQFKTDRKVGKTGVMLIGLGGNNGW